MKVWHSYIYQRLEVYFFWWLTSGSHFDIIQNDTNIESDKSISSSYKLQKNKHRKKDMKIWIKKYWTKKVEKNHRKNLTNCFFCTNKLLPITLSVTIICLSKVKSVQIQHQESVWEHENRKKVRLWHSKILVKDEHLFFSIRNCSRFENPMWFLDFPWFNK